MDKNFEDMQCSEITVEFRHVTKDSSDVIPIFLKLGRNYMQHIQNDKRERFLQSMIDRQEEPDRWLLLLKVRDEYIGFVHMKIDKDEQPGWGFILEFYIVPTKRRLGWGRKMFTRCLEILQARDVKDMWLLTNPFAEPFWRKLGFRVTGERDRETGQKIMIMSIYNINISESSLARYDKISYVEIYAHEILINLRDLG